MNKLPEHTTQEREQGQEVRTKPFPAIDPPAVIANDGGGQGKPDVLQLLAQARAKQRREKPDLEPGQVWITLPDFLNPEQDAAVMQSIDEAAGLSGNARVTIDVGRQAEGQQVKRLIGILEGRYTPEGIKHFFADLGKIKDLIELVEDPPDEVACVKELIEKHGSHIPAQFIRDAIRELRRYPAERRRGLIDAAYRQARQTARQATKLGKMQADYGQALQVLSPREKALMRIVYQVNELSGSIDADFSNVWRSVAADWPVDVLRGDPACAELLEIFDLSELLAEALN
jgi:hypothetical protein